jgi:D-threo-aldose 1-dehydrogenase
MVTYDSPSMPISLQNLNSQIKESSILFGTSSLGNLYQTLPYEKKKELIRETLTHAGQRPIFDTAGKYGAGLALETLGQILRDLDISPDMVSISNKLAWKQTELITPEPTFEPGVWKNLKNDAACDISYDGIMECFQQGADLLGKPYGFDLLSVHDPDEYLGSATNEKERDQRFGDILEGYRALEKLKKDGVTQSIGIGSKDWRIIASVVEEVDLDWVMLACSLTPYIHDLELVEFIETLRRRDVLVVNSAVFNGGFLVGGNHFDYRSVSPDEDPELFSWRTTFLGLCKNHDVNPAVACIQFGMQLPGVVATALNTTDPSKVKRNVDAVKAQVPADFWDALRNSELVNSDYPFTHLISSSSTESAV